MSLEFLYANAVMCGCYIAKIIDILTEKDITDKIEFKPDCSYFEVDDISIKVDWINRKCSAFSYGEFQELIEEKDGD